MPNLRCEESLSGPLRHAQPDYGATAMEFSRAWAALDTLVNSKETMKPACRLPLQATTTPEKFTLRELAGVSIDTVISVQTGMEPAERNSIPFLRIRTALAGKSSRVVCAWTVKED